MGHLCGIIGLHALDLMSQAQEKPHLDRAIPRCVPMSNMAASIGFLDYPA